jgi:RHS repeat-associated protein
MSNPGMSRPDDGQNKPTPNAETSSAPVASPNPTQSQNDESKTRPEEPQALPSVSMPKGGGAIRGIGEKFSVSPATGTGSISVPIKTSAGRPGSGVELHLSYNSGSGNSPFGLGWQVSSQSIVRKTDKGLPQYQDDIESDMFLLSGSEDLVPKLTISHDDKFGERVVERRCENGRHYTVAQYQPRIESGFSRILRFIDEETGKNHWEVKSGLNATTIFGENDNSRIFDPKHPSHIFEWLPTRSFDDRGNAIHYEYKVENSEDVDVNALHEQHRTDLMRSAARYPKRIKYGNTKSMLSKNFESTDWLFEVVFDYGDHDEFRPLSAESRPWPARADPFSTYRSGFEIRKYRLCQRVLMFHHFPEEPGIGRDCVVSALRLFFQEMDQQSSCGLANVTVLKSVIQENWLRDGSGYKRDSPPPVKFGYTYPKISSEMQDMNSHSVINLPVGLGGDSYQFVDLEGQGLAGIVSWVQGTLMYVPNLGEGEFGAARTLPSVPQTVMKAGSKRWMDLSGSGKMDLVQLQGTTPGFYKRNWYEESGWDPFRTFNSLPNLAWDDKNLKFIDLTGDGLSDVLIAGDSVLTLYQGKGDEGYDSPTQTFMPLDEQSGPRFVFSDGSEVIYTADMTGDGLSDLVRIRSREVCFWPNQGYGNFGSKIVMANPPDFDFPDGFNQSLLRLVDINGTGTTDLLYLGGKNPTIYHNLSGNAWLDGKTIASFPGMDVTKDVQVVDILGRGTACLVWSSSLPSDLGRQLRYLDLMKEGKPYLLTTVDNNLGWVTQVEYLPSTHYYAMDQKAGRVWTSNLPFPVQCVSRSTSVDRISGNVFETTYTYHDGYFDGIEREFRGFGMVESRDTENFSDVSHLHGYSNVDQAYHLPPTLTKTWYHTGEYRNGFPISRYSDTEYYREDTMSEDEVNAFNLSDSELPCSIRAATGNIPHDLLEEEIREACRALKGSTLRSEVYSLDGSNLERIPYTIKESNFIVEQRQQLGPNRYGVFFVRPNETLEMVYDRKMYQSKSGRRADPRLNHSMILETDIFGNPLSTLAVTYGRRYDDPSLLLCEEDRQRQRRSHSTLTVSRLTNSINSKTEYLLPKAAEARSFEVVNIDSYRCFIDRSKLKGLVEFDVAINLSQSLSSGRFDIPFEVFDGPYPSITQAYRRLFKHSRSLYRSNNMAKILEVGQVESQALPYKNFQLSFTDTQVQRFIDDGKFSEVNITRIFKTEGGYTRFPDVKGWWSTTGEAFYARDRNSTPAEELQQARDHFYTIRRSITPFDTDSEPCQSFYDFDKYDLLIQEITNPSGNRSTVGERDVDSSKPLIKQGHDYRVLAPYLMMDANRNCSRVAFDVLGNVTGTALMGKPEEKLGDSLDDFELTLTEKDNMAYFKNPVLLSSTFLGSATSRTFYDLHAYYRTKDTPNPKPTWTSQLRRETHVSDLTEGMQTRIFASFSFSDGSGRVIQAKVQCEPGPLDPSKDEDDSDDEKQQALCDHRWLTSSWVIFNNKNNPVKKYEPFFTSTHHFEDKAIRGVSPTMIYDAVSRNIATVYPDHTWSKIVFDPWGSEEWDKNDNVLIKHAGVDPDVGSFVRRLPKTDYFPSWYEQRIDGTLGNEQRDAAQKAAALAETPTYSFFDTLGRKCVGFEILRTPTLEGKVPKDEIMRQVFFMDIQGLQYKLEDTLSRIVNETVFSISGNWIRQSNMDSGKRWVLNDVAGHPMFSWDSREHRLRTEYDRSRRAIAVYLQQGREKEVLVETTAYGETQPNAEQSNSRGRVIVVYDQSGISRTPKYDYKGNVLGSSQELVKNFRITTDWEENVELESETYESSITYDALNKVRKTVLPDGTVTLYNFNERGLTTNVTTSIAGGKDFSTVIEETEYDAKGRRILVLHGNGVETRATYNDISLRLIRSVSIRKHKKKSTGSHKHHNDYLQDLRYFYDAIGNITAVKDDAKHDIFFRNHRVTSTQAFTYDSAYQLVEATGREHLGQMNNAKDSHGAGQISPSLDARIDQPNDAKAVGRYIERYQYDTAGNILKMWHRNQTESREWTRHYAYEEPSLVDPSSVNNRLTYTRVGKITEYYRYEGIEGVHGNMTSMPGLPSMKYDYRDRMVSSIQTRTKDENSTCEEFCFYSYDSTGKRIRKVIERKSKNPAPVRVKEFLYIGGAFEIFRRYNGNGDISTEVQSISIAESGQRVALIDNRIKGTDDRAPSLLYRYTLGNYQGSSIIEIDENASIISFEEYLPYGGTALQASYKQTDVPKRYRFLGKEKDETGLYHLGARYYAAWLGRFTSADPKGLVDGLNLFQYSHGNPVMLSDAGGTNATPAELAKLGWDEKEIYRRANMYKDLSRLSDVAAKIREWNFFGRSAAQNFGRYIQAGMENPAVIEVEKYYKSVLGTVKGSSFIDFQFAALKQTWEHKLIDVERYLDHVTGQLDVNKLDEAIGGWVKQVEKHSANVAKEVGWGKTNVGITIRGAEEGGELFTTVSSKIKGAMNATGSSTTIVHEMDDGLKVARAELDALAATKLGGLVKGASRLAKGMTVLGVGLAVMALPGTAHAMTDSKLAPSKRVQAGFDTLNNLGTIAGTAGAVAGAAAKLGLGGQGATASMTTGAGATAVGALSVVGAGLATGTAVGGFVEDSTKNFFQEKLGEQGGAAAAAGTGVLAGAAAGAVVGAVIGSVVPGIGTAAGAAVGAIAGAAGAAAKSIISKLWD